MTVHNMILSTTETMNNIGLVQVRQGDKASQTFVAKIIENNISKDDIYGYSVFLNVMFKGNIIARDRAKLDYGTWTVKYTLKDSFFQQVGKVTAYFSFEKDGVIDSTADFEYEVIPGACKNIRQGNYIVELEELYSMSEDIIKNKDFTSLLKLMNDVNRKVEDLEYKFDQTTKKVQTDIDNHKNDKKNPHEVTPKQIGAITPSELTSTLTTTLAGRNIFEGVDYFSSEKEYTYTMSEMKLGLVLTWCAYTIGEGPDDAHFKTQLIPKTQILRWAGRSSSVILEAHSGKRARKMVYANLVRISGNVDNAEGDNRNFVLRKITVI